MNKLSYQTLKEKEFTGYLLKEAPERVIQFGEGNFMRAFVDFFIDNMNEKADFNSKVVLVQPIAPIPGAFDLKDAINEQEGLYTLYLRGCENDEKVNKKRIISCVSRCLNAYTDFDAVMACAENPQLRFISCNTTEAGITYDPACRFEDRPASSYPGKLTQFLYHRFQTFGSQPGKGFLILACELIDDNGKELEKCVLKYASQWNLGQDFIQWLQKENTFCSTLVDRIVTGFPRTEAPALNEENGYEDNVMDTGEIFGFWVIEGPQSIRTELPFEKAGLPILVTDDHKPYKQRKVRILNGAHTSMVLGAYLAGQDIVRDCMEDPTIQGFMNKAIYDEIIPTLTLPKEELQDFAASVTERFRNPYIDHALLSISLNSTSKWKARVMPSLKGYLEKTGTLPKCITASFAFYLAFYRGQELKEDGFHAVRGNDEYIINDDHAVLEFFNAHK
ncbi:tagaturonate reductase, partial [Eisenbergiella tayi]|uniref:tagaturonate reductase n=1 Tax=Eisenbergiella tayi TaxID=1432052 RepID=UPI003AF0BD2A